MDASVLISKAVDRNGLRRIRLMSGGHEFDRLDFDPLAFRALPNPGPLALDFLIFAAAIYALDKRSARSSARDGWTRRFSLHVPVSAPKTWDQVRRDLESCLGFLTGDVWSLEFSRRRHGAHEVLPVGDASTDRPKVTAVTLFSGGLDSLAGAIDWLASRRGHLMLVGHHDGQMAGPLSDQTGLERGIKKRFRSRTSSFFARVGHAHKSSEITLRGRSLLFVALGTLAAESAGPGVPLLIPENGNIALNVPLTPSRRGSCSTRTAHPYYLEQLRGVLARLGLDHDLQNPHEEKTKGEVLQLCKDQVLLKALAPLSVSCAKRGHRRTWIRRDAKGCGRCMPCIFRRAALHHAGMDDEVFGVDICSGELDLDRPDLEAPNDLRACLSFLRHGYSESQLSHLLRATAPINPHRLGAFAAVVARAMEELRDLLRAKATKDILNRAGLVP